MSLFIDIEKAYPQFYLSLTLSVANGEILGLIGKSGSGKSLTLKSIAGIITPDKGIIKLDDNILFDHSTSINLSAQKRKVGYLFQSYALFPHMSAKKNIACGIKDKENADSIIKKLATLLHIENLLHHYPNQLSGGQQQRVALARLLASKPKALLLDEAFSAIDDTLKENFKKELLPVLKDFACPVIFVSHNKNEINNFCSNTIEINAEKN
ncbi:MAG: sulfate/molybdate ABC transporter ATP-binding protein [Treponemataceae bacterium]